MRPSHVFARRRSRLALISIWLLACTPAGARGTGGAYDVDKAVIAVGGTTSSGGAFRLDGTLGQPATAVLNGSGYTLQDGFWAPVGVVSDRIFANGFDP